VIYNNLRRISHRFRNMVSFLFKKRTLFYTLLHLTLK